MTNARLTGLTLTGFQVFETRTHVPLNRLTLMFGPNSAGKSAIADALKTIFSMFDPSQVGLIEQSQSKIYRDQALPLNEFPMLRPHWRRVNSSGTPYAPLMEVDVDVECSSRINLDRDQVGLGYYVHKLSILTSHRLTHSQGPPHAVGFPSERLPHQISSEPGVKQAHPQGNDPPSSDGFDRSHSTLTLKINGSILISASTKGTILVNLAHDSLLFKKDEATFNELSLNCPGIFDNSEGLLKIENLGELLLWGNRTPQLDLHGAEVIAYEQQEMVDSGLVFSAAHSLKRAWDGIWFFVSGVVNELRNDFHHVNASRTIPSREELTFLRLGDEQNANFGSHHVFKREGPYSAVAFSLAREPSERNSVRPTATGEIEGRKGKGNPGERVNDWLTGYFFRDRGYRLGYNRWDLVYSTDVGQREGQPGGIPPCLVELLIRDERGVPLEFMQVGSGIGYVFPVLAALSGTSKLAWIEQPELHLHPALQCELGDVVLDAMNRGVGQCIVETHSEHFLLRILRRIRESFSENKPIRGLRWDPRDLSVLYFEPKMDGSSTVRQLRVDEDGDFLDRWPQGFFSERDKELFGE